jgi:phosphoesterase RecJ-like protein
MMDQIIEQLKASRSVLVTTHVNPDGDAIGSLIAMGRIMSLLDKRVVMYNESRIPAVYRFLPKVNDIRRTLPDGETFDTAIVLDCGRLARVGKAVSRIDAVPTVINLDHHQTNTGFGDARIIDTEACATAEIVYRLFCRLNLELDDVLAISIYTAILTDTGSFRFSNTNQEAFRIGETMIRAGVDPYKVAQHVYGTYSLGRIKLLNLALDSIEISDNGKMSIMTLWKEMLEETGTKREDVDGIINYARNIQDIKIAALLHELEGNGSGPDSRHTWHVSLRSDGDVDVAAIAAQYGGGGHTTAAGFNVEASLMDLKERIIRLGDEL